jgi:2'-5' RNA ligase
LTQDKNKDTLFFGAKVVCNWPKSFPEGKVISNANRHITLVYIGKVDEEMFVSILNKIPDCNFQIGSCGFFDGVLFYPKTKPRVCAFNIFWMDEKVVDFTKNLTESVKSICNIEPITSYHLSICRSPQSTSDWQEAFSPRGFYVESIELLKSLGSSEYKCLYEKRFHPPFIEIEHTADLAFSVFGFSFIELYENGFLALGFKDEKIFEFWKKCSQIDLLEDVVIKLNEAIYRLDEKYGTKLKAVCFHMDVKKSEDLMYVWEMVVDV